jgi:hypothetical protein
MVENTTRLHRPKVLVISGPSRWILNLPQDLDRKERRKQLEKLGYCCLEWFMSGQQGSALQQERLIEVCIDGSKGRAMPVAPPHQGLPVQPMKNLLLPPGTIPCQSMATPKLISWLTEAGPPKDGLLIVGLVGRQPLHSSTGCMPDELGAWIADSDTGVRRLQAEELVKGKEIPSKWRTKAVDLPSRPIEEAMCLHIWTAVCDTLGQWLKPQGQMVHPTLLDPLPQLAPNRRPTVACTLPNPQDMPSAEWDYKLPDLVEGGKWHQDSITSLWKAIQG